MRQSRRSGYVGIDVLDTVVRAEDVDDLVFVELLERLTSWTEVLTWVKFSWVFSEDLTYSSGHSQTTIRVDVDLADGALRSLTELLFGDTDSILEGTTELVDRSDFVLRYAGRTVEYDGEARDLLFDLSEDVEAEGGRYEDTVSITLALLGRELVSTVRRTDGDSQRVNTRLADEVDYFFRLGVGVVLSYDIIFDTSEDTEFTFDRDVELVSVLNDRTRQSNVLVVGEVRTVDHHRGEAHFDTALAELEAITVVKVKGDLRISAAQLLSVFDSTLSHVAQERLVSVLTCAAGYLKNDRRLGFYCSADDSLQLLHVIEVECWDSVATLDSLSEHIAGVHQTQFFVTNHYCCYL